VIKRKKVFLSICVFFILLLFQILSTEADKATVERTAKMAKYASTLVQGDRLRELPQDTESLTQKCVMMIDFFFCSPSSTTLQS